ncbi:MAG TPA: OmpH family outer membrane protein [Pirellulales bacterium]|nr:OmpH family outer membrane protein [Pirellulales bacterium]
MKKCLSLAVLAVGLSMAPAGANSAFAQPRSTGSAPQVAIIDLAYIFNNHVKFKALSDELRRDVEAAENELKQNKSSLQKMAERLEELNRNSPDYRQLEEDIAKRSADLSVQVQLQKKEFFEKEAKIYYTVYQEIMEQVKYHADKHGIALVMRFNGDPLDENDPQGIQKELNKAVLYYNKTIDITPIILDAVNPPRSRPTTTSPQPDNRLGRPPQGVLPPNGVRRQ